VLRVLARFQGERRVPAAGQLAPAAESKPSPDAQVEPILPLGSPRQRAGPTKSAHCAAARFSPRPLTLSSIGF
jgi:hypothetical protein